jgi:hypothetical protein
MEVTGPTTLLCVNVEAFVHVERDTVMISESLSEHDEMLRKTVTVRERYYKEILSGWMPQNRTIV